MSLNETLYVRANVGNFEITREYYREIAGKPPQKHDKVKMKSRLHHNKLAFLLGCPHRSRPVHRHSPRQPRKKARRPRQARNIDVKDHGRGSPTVASVPNLRARLRVPRGLRSRKPKNEAVCAACRSGPARSEASTVERLHKDERREDEAEGGGGRALNARSCVGWLFFRKPRNEARKIGRPRAAEQRQPKRAQAP